MVVMDNGQLQQVQHYLAPSNPAIIIQIIKYWQHFVLYVVWNLQHISDWKLFIIVPCWISIWYNIIGSISSSVSKHDMKQPSAFSVKTSEAVICWITINVSARSITPPQCKSQSQWLTVYKSGYPVGAQKLCLFLMLTDSFELCGAIRRSPFILPWQHACSPACSPSSPQLLLEWRLCLITKLG